MRTCAGRQPLTVFCYSQREEGKQTCRMLPKSHLFMCLAASIRTPATPSCASMFRYWAALACTGTSL